MANSPILNIPQVTANQAAKEVTINDATSRVERSLNDKQIIDLTAGDVEVDFADYTLAMIFFCTGHVVPRVLTVPASKRFFMVFNDGSGAVTVDPDGGATVVVPPGSYVIMINDGTDLHKIADSAASGSVTAFLDLPDAPTDPDYVGQGGKAIVVRMTEDGLEFGTIAVSFLGLTDTPDSYVGQALKGVRVNSGATALELFTFPSPGATNFLGLTDVPDSYLGAGLKVVGIKATEDGVEFVDFPEPVIREDRTVTGTNLGFEAGSTTGWSIDDGGGFSVVTSFGGIAAASEGTKFLKYDAADGDAAISQIFDLQPLATNAELDDNSQIEVRVACASPDAVDTGKIEIQFLTAANAFISAEETGEFLAGTTFIDKRVRFDLPIGTRKVKLILHAYDNNAGTTQFAFDDIRPILKVPVSATELASLTDVNIPSPADEDVLTYDTATSKWIAAASSAAGKVDKTGDTMTGALTMNVSAALTNVWTAAVASSAGVRIDARKARGSIASPATVNNADAQFELLTYGYGASAFELGARLTFSTFQGSPSNTAMGTKLTLLMNTVGTVDQASVMELEWTNGLQLFGGVVVDPNRLITLRQYTNAGKPSASGLTGKKIFVTDYMGGVEACSDGTDWVVAAVSLTYAISDESTAITTGAAKLIARAPHKIRVTGVRASLSTASSSGNPAFDINESGSTILSTTITIDSSERTSVTAATPPVVSDTSIADDAELTFDIDTAGTGAKGAKITIIGKHIL